MPLLVLVDRPVIEYLMPTTPVYQTAGILGFVVLLVLGAVSTQGPRRRLWRSHRGFQAFHVVLSIVAVVLITVHVVVSARYVRGWIAAAAYVAITIAALAMLLRERKGARTNVAGHGLVESRGVRSAFDARGRSDASGLCGVPLLLPGTVEMALRATALPRAEQLPIAFAHEKHTVVNCLVCHHNYVDKSGPGACISCHRSGRGDIKVSIEPRFHTFCFDCHRDPGRPFKNHGPVAGCESCHQGSHPSRD